MEPLIAPEAVGLDAIINCDSEGIAVCLTNQPHLVDFGVMNQQIIDLDGLGDMIGGTQESGQPVGPVAVATGDVLAVPMAVKGGLVTPVMVGVGAAEPSAGTPGGDECAMVPEVRKGPLTGSWEMGN